MKKLLITVTMVCALAVSASAQSKKVTELPADTAPTSDDLVMTVNDPAGTPVSKKATLANLFFAERVWSYCADAGSTDAYACSLSPAPSAYVTGADYWVKANTANTGAATVNFNSLGAKTIKKVAGGVTTDLDDNDIRANQILHLVYDGTNMQLVSGLGNAASGGASVNPTSLFVPYNNAGTFADSRIKRENTNITGINGGLNTSQTFKIYDSDDGSGNAGWLQFAVNGSGRWEMLSTSSGSASNKEISFGVSGSSNRMKLGTGDFSPTVDRGYDFGQSSTRWNQAFIFKVIINGDGLLFQSGPQLVSGGGGWLQITDSGGSGNLTRISMGDPGATGVSLTKPASQTYVEVRDGNNSNYVPVVALKHCYSGTTVCDFAGSGSPESVVTASVGSTYRRTDGGAGTSFYVKESGSGNTGWVAK